MRMKSHPTASARDAIRPCVCRVEHTMCHCRSAVNCRNCFCSFLLSVSFFILATSHSTDTKQDKNQRFDPGKTAHICTNWCKSGFDFFLLSNFWIPLLFDNLASIVSNGRMNGLSHFSPYFDLSSCMRLSTTNERFVISYSSIAARNRIWRIRFGQSNCDFSVREHQRHCRRTFTTQMHFVSCIHITL